MTYKAFEVWNCGNIAKINLGETVTVFKCGSGHSTFGEAATLARATKQHLVFVTESGAEVKTPIDNISITVGKAAVEGYRVSLKAFDAFKEMIKSPVLFWDQKARKLVNK